jgi:hypothetical protein
MYMNYFSSDDLVFYQDKQSGRIMSGGYNINSILLQKGVAPMTTLNSNSNIQDDDNMLGGTKSVSNIFDNLAVPAGLYYNEQKQRGGSNNIQYSNAEPLSEDIHDKLFKLVEVNTKTKQKTCKNRNTKDKDIKKYSRKFK